MTKSNSKSRNRLFVILSLGLLLFLNCVRGIAVGNDTESYLSIFNFYKGQNQGLSFQATGWMGSLEIGYVFINKIFLLFSSSYQLFISIIAVFLYIVLAKTILDYSDSVAISVIISSLVLYHIYINVLREAIAMSIILIGYRFLTKDKKICFILLIFLAFLFHKTAILALPLLFLYRQKPFKKVIPILIFSIVVAFTVFGVFSRIISIFFSDTKYLNESSGLSTYFAVIFAALIWFLLHLFKVKPMEQNSDIMKKYNFYSAIPFIHLCIQIAAINMQILFRVGYYYIAFYILVIPFFYKNSSLSLGKKRMVLSLLHLVLLVYTFGLVFYRPEWYSEFNYSFFWNE